MTRTMAMFDNDNKFIKHKCSNEYECGQYSIFNMF